MKVFRCCLKGGQLFALAIVVLSCAANISAQTAASGTVSVVTVQATQPIATAGNPGVFTVFRAGSTDATLNVWYDLGGTASNGVDYATIPPHLVTIDAGATSSVITITPLTNEPSGVVSKTLILQLGSSPLLNPVNYEIGSPSNAVIFIKDPVGIISPKEGTTFYAPTNIQIVAFLNDVNWLTNVEFFAGTKDLGKGILNTGGISGFSGLTWTNPAVGNYALTAVASYNDLAWILTKPPVGCYAVTSAPVNITVQLPPTNLPPVVNILAPPNDTAFYTPTNIQIMAKASDLDGSVTNVEFFAGATDLGPGTPVALDPLVGGGISGLVYLLNWQSAQPGHYPLTAVATDNGGAPTTSAAVNIIVLKGPPTNQPPVVRIISPPNGSTFFAPINIPIYTYANDPDGAVASVEFFDGGNSLGFGQPVTVVPPQLPPGPIQPPILIVAPTNYWELTWSNAPAGPHALTAKGTDNNGAVTVSDPVKIAILPSPPPPTNRPPMVSIVASDPVAIEGTNCWVWPGETNATPTWAAWPTAVCRLFTNCGPKTATFTVRRDGDTNGNLTVTYTIGGTASNGVDYIALPGLATIPAGERSGLITIVPIDDGPPDVNKTVILTLAPDTNLPPSYVIGFPPRAAAVILDSNGPQPATGLLPDGCFHLVTAGPDAAWFCIEYSTNLNDWTPVCTNQVVNGSINFVDPGTAGDSSRFYRVVPLANPPAQ